MKLRRATSIWSLVLAAAGAAPLSPGDTSSVRQAVAALSDESYAARERATRDLWSLGEGALPELRKAEAGEDPEAAVRARDLIRKIELGILPDSSPRIVDLVMRYDRGGQEEQREVIGLLKRERAWRQILKLYALEKNEDSLAMLEESVRGVAVDAARECLAAEPADIAGAFAFLEMARPEAPELMAAAALHRANGTLEQELEKASQLTGKRGHLWRYALLAAAGRPEEAAAQAELAGLGQTAARLRLLTGDPLPWLKIAQPAGQVIPAVGLPSYREFAIRTWQGKPLPTDLTRSLRRLARGGDEDEQSKALRLLFLTGDYAEGEKLLAKLDPSAAFYYFEAAERVEEALRVFGLDPVKPDFKSWVLKRFRTLADDDGDGSEIGELAMIGYFLEHRGLYEELDDAFTQPLVELGRADQEIFANTITRLFRGTFARLSIVTVRPVIQATAAYAGDDDVRWSLMVENLFNFLESPDQLWSWLGTLDPTLDRKERLEWLSRIFGFLPDDKGDRARFFELAWKAIDKTEPAARQPLLELVAGVNEILLDKETTLRCVDALGLGDNLLVLRDKGAAYAGLGRWKDAAATWQKVVELSPGNVVDRVQAATCFRRAGDEAAADLHEHRAELLAMGESRVQIDAGDVFALAGDFERAARWWQRAATECTREISFPDALARMNDHAEASGDWKSMAAFSEVQAFQHALASSGSFRIPPNFAMSASLQLRLDSGLSRAISRLAKSREDAIAEIGRWSAMPYADLAMADHFFAPLREAGLAGLHDKIFERMWLTVTKRIESYPACDNSRNSAAWLASRANRRLAEAEGFLKEALDRNPRQAAYLDTMAEIHFSRGDRKKALELSTRALHEEPLDLQIIRQHQRFETGKFPPR